MRKFVSLPLVQVLDSPAHDYNIDCVGKGGANSSDLQSKNFRGSMSIIKVFEVTKTNNKQNQALKKK